MLAVPETRGTYGGNRIPRWYLDQFTIRTPEPPKHRDVPDRLAEFLRDI